MLIVGAAVMLALSPVFASAGTTTTTTTATTTTTTTPSSSTTTTTTPKPKTYLGPDGVVSSAIVAENRLTGTSAWRIGANVSSTAVQGFANFTAAAQGQDVKFYVTTQAPSFRAVAFRMGWYQGLGARQVWASPVESGVSQPACSVAPTTNMVSCANWSVSFVMPITSAFTPGDYLIKLLVGPKGASYVPLTIWDPQSTATYVIMNRSFVEQGWNTYGGYSFYAGLGPCILDSASYPPCNRARVVSFDRPYDTGDGASDFLTNEYPLVRLCEREGLDVTYITDVTLDEHPNLLLHHKVLLSLDHDESWSYEERLAVERAVNHGVNIVYFGAAAMVRHVRLQASPLGPDREEVDYRDAYEDPLNGVGNPMQVTGNTWESPPADWSPVAQIGEEYSGYLSPGVTAPMVISNASSWVFKGTSFHDGTSLPGVIASDFDHVIPSSATPSNIEILAHSPIPSEDGTVSGDIWDGVSYSDMVYFTNPTSNAGVIDTGNNVWIGDLRTCCDVAQYCEAPTLSKITNNILWLFGQGPAGELEPATSNLNSISPEGS
ncbi:MAG: N,N-dimethylformamidase beta subunit family domain-containing protein [Acidimicrobiales bacterium]